MSILNNWIVKNLLLAAALVLGIALVVGITLGLVTHHNQEIEVPDLINLSPERASEVAGVLDLRTEVVDSVYVRMMDKHAIFNQNPPAGSKVKKGRLIRLTINSMNPKKVMMPNLVGYSMRQAKAELSSKGLQLGKLVYVDDIATNDVLKQLYRGREINSGVSLPMGSSIDLVVGLNQSDNKTLVPDVTGMKYMRAKDAIHDNSLNVYKTVFDNSVKNYSDTINAVVFRQTPSPSDMPVDMGSEVSLYLTLDPSKAPSR